MNIGDTPGMQTLMRFINGSTFSNTQELQEWLDNHYFIGVEDLSEETWVNMNLESQWSIIRKMCKTFVGDTTGRPFNVGKMLMSLCWNTGFEEHMIPGFTNMRMKFTVQFLASLKGVGMLFINPMLVRVMLNLNMLEGLGFIFDNTIDAYCD